ncbi:MAG: RNA methyltransferase [Butyrivibrio sp.]|nr:RNA methyltransferase [Butyrivibrio sp.]
MFPDKFEQRMKDLLGEKEYDEFLTAFDKEEERVHALRINGLKVPDEKQAQVVANAIGTSDNAKEISSEDRVCWESKGFYYTEAASPGKHPYHEAGLYYIQEPSAMAPVHFLDPKPGDRVLDLCAAPGGKSTQIASRMEGRGLLVTNEINTGRAKILSLNIERMGIGNALVLNEDSAHLSQVFEGYFDKILVDAPCSGEGMFRKNDNAAEEWSLENVKLCAARQEEILDNAAKMLLPGGRLVYSTCTFAPEENEINVAKFLIRHPDFMVEKVKLFGGMEEGRAEFVRRNMLAAEALEAGSGAGVSGEDIGSASVDNETVGSASIDNETTGSTSSSGDAIESFGSECIRNADEISNGEDRTEGGSEGQSEEEILSQVGESVRLWPHKVRGEGHFLCVFHRDGETDKDAQKTYIPGGRNPAAKSDVIKVFKEFEKETLKGLELKGEYLSFGDQLYLIPSDMPGIRGLKVMRPGLHLGTVKKDRFEPSHALALFLKKDDAALTVDFASDSLEIRQFLNGQSIRASREEHPKLSKSKGWCLVTCDSFSIGWAKLAGGMLKNHYPKGLRINY